MASDRRTFCHPNDLLSDNTSYFCVTESDCGWLGNDFEMDRSFVFNRSCGLIARSKSRNYYSLGLFLFQMKTLTQWSFKQCD